MIIGISGPIGAGKDTAAEYIEQILGFKHVSGGDILRGIISQIGFAPTKVAVAELGAMLRRNYGADAILKLVIDKGAGSHIVNSGFRSPDEAKLISESGGVVLYIDAPQNVRHERVQSRDRSDDKGLNLVSLDSRESKSESSLEDSLLDVKQQADYVIVNDGTLESFYEQIDTVIAQLDIPKAS